RVRDVQIARCIEGDTRRTTELRESGRAAIAAVTPRSVACHGADETVRGNPADAVVTVVRDVQIARPIHGHAIRTIELRGSGWAAIAAVTRCFIACHGADETVRGNLADAAVPQVRDVQIARPIHGHTKRNIELRGSGWAAIAAVTGCSIAC